MDEQTAEKIADLASRNSAQEQQIIALKRECERLRDEWADSENRVYQKGWSDARAQCEVGAADREPDKMLLPQAWMVRAPGKDQPNRLTFLPDEYSDDYVKTPLYAGRPPTPPREEPMAWMASHSPPEWDSIYENRERALEEVGGWEPSVVPVYLGHPPGGRDTRPTPDECDSSGAPTPDEPDDLKHENVHTDVGVGRAARSVRHEPDPYCDVCGGYGVNGTACADCNVPEPDPVRAEARRFRSEGALTGYVVVWPNGQERHVAWPEWEALRALQEADRG